MDETKLLPIRVVQPSRDFFKRDNRKGDNDLKYFIENESEIRKHRIKLITEIDVISEDLQETFEKFKIIPNIIKAKLKEEALAKSHRPKILLDKDTCPIIGLDQIGELLLSTTRTGLTKLKKKIEETIDKKEIANITAIEKIELFGIKEKLLGLDIKKLDNLSKRNGKTHLKVILFNHQDNEINKLTIDNFKDWIHGNGLQIETVTRLKNLNIWKVVGANKKQMIEITQHPAVRTLSFFPTYEIIKPNTLAKEMIFPSFPQPVQNQEYARIGIIDTGIPHNHQILGPWVIEHSSFIPEKYANKNHGSFVGGLASLGQHLNGRSICPDEDPIKLLDVQVLANNDSQHGDIDTITEDVLMANLEDSIPQFTNKYNIRIWNMSLGLSFLCEQERFSNLAVFLDELQDQCDIMFTLPSGNLIRQNEDQRTWPPQEEIKDEDYLEVPADSARAITVGAIACSERPDSCVRINEPTSYSRRGPGPSYIVKPELIHYSGNLSSPKPGEIDLFGQGIVSFDENGELMEDGGTSFSSPLVARTFALLHNNLLPEPSTILMKALIIHNSYLPKKLGTPENIMPYVGFGMPKSSNEILNCHEHEITLIFEQEIIDGYTLDYTFPWPQSLKDESGQCRGNVKVTLVADSPLDSSFGAEYIRANIDASLRALKYNRNGELVWSSREIFENPSTNDLSKLYEKEKIKNGFKWKPIKRYERTLKRLKAEDWMIRVRLLLRDGFELGTESIKFALIFTISDPNKKAPVYNEVVNSLRQRNVFTNEIQIKSKIRIKSI